MGKLVGILALLLVAPALARPLPARVGDRAPMFELERVQGSEPGGLDQLRGRVVLIQFWATYCGWCKSTHPALAAFAREQGPSGVAVLGISSQARGRLTRYLDDHRLGFTALHDRRHRVARRYGVRGTPTFVVIDQKGIVRFTASGAPAAKRAIVAARSLRR